MSMLLERMIRRTRAPLSSLEPLSGPNFALPVQRGEPGPRTDGHLAGQPEEGPGAWPWRPPARPAGDGRADRLAGSGPGPLSGAPAPEPEPAPAPGPAQAQAPATGRPGAGRATSAPGRPAPRSAAARRLDHGLGQPGPDPGATYTRHAGQEPGEAGGKAGDAGERSVGETAATAAAEPEAAPAYEPVTAASVRLRPPAPPARLQAGPPTAPQPPGQDADTWGGRPEVTVSIGHIEVRSGPASEKPRTRPSFRPEVGLADFLGQPQDRRP